MDPFDTASDRAPEVLESLLQSRPDYADVFFHSIAESIVEAKSSLRGSRFGRPRRKRRARTIQGVGLRMIDNGRVGFAATTDLSPDGLRRAATSVVMVQGDKASDFQPEIRKGPTDPNETLIDEAGDLLDACLAASDNVEAASVHISRIQIRRRIAAHHASFQKDQSSRMELRASVVSAGKEVSTVRTFFEGRDEVDDALRSIVRRLASKTRRLERVYTPVKERLPVVLPPGWGAVWLHEAVGHQLEADSVAAGDSALSDWIGRSVASESVTIVDSPLVGGRVSQAFDDEGVPSRETTLIDRGRIVGLLSDRFTSLTSDLPLTGNGRRAHYAELPRPRMTNLVLGSGSRTRASIIGSVSRGIYVSDIRHAWYRPDTGRVHLDVAEATLIEGGELTETLSRFVLAATPVSLLKGITAIADDSLLETDRGYCLKGGAAIPVGVGQPTVLIDSFELSE